MQDFHTIPVQIADGDNSQAFFSYQPATTLVVFVHGFKGSALGTWDDFPEAVTNDADFAHTDFIFYGYDTLSASASFHATAFKKFLERCVHPLAGKVLPATQGLPERVYTNIILVAHSLGALVVRQAVVMACKQDAAWLPKISLLLFAPAHTGARVQKLAKEVLSGWTALISPFVTYQYPVYEDLEPGSQFIATLVDETKKLLADKKYPCNIARKVIWAERDRVVSQINFCDDPDAELVYKKNHVNVCKPDATYTQPVDFLKELLHQ